MTFAEFYADYPRKIGKKDAEKAWNALKVTTLIANHIRETLNKRKREDWKGRQLKYIPYPAHFLRAEGFDEEEEVMVDETLPIHDSHLCKICEPEHVWKCEDELCTLGKVAPCSKVLERYSRK